MLEATARIGGRAWTYDVAGMQLDLGCGWLHSADRNPWTRVAEAAGFAVDRRGPAWGRQYHDIGFSQTEQAAARRAYAAWEQRMATAPASDCAADVLEREGEWNAYLQAISGLMNGVGLEHVSVADYTAYDAAATGYNWRTPAGYGTLVAASLPHPIDLRLSTPVEIHRTGRTLRAVDDPARRRLRPDCYPCRLDRGAGWEHYQATHLVWTLGVTPRPASRLDATKSSSSRSLARVRSRPRGA